jgi:hypothetical protein
MQLAQFKGVSRVSKAIRLLTRSEYSHTALLFDDAAWRTAQAMGKAGWEPKNLKFMRPGSVVEAWHNPSAVANSPDISTLHSPGTPVDIFRLNEPFAFAGEEALIRYLDSIIGIPYAFRDVLRFTVLSRLLSGEARRGESGRLFCSEAAFIAFDKGSRTLLARIEAWKVYPGMIPLSPLLVLDRTTVTG